MDPQVVLLDAVPTGSVQARAPVSGVQPNRSIHQPRGTSPPPSPRPGTSSAHGCGGLAIAIVTEDLGDGAAEGRPPARAGQKHPGGCAIGMRLCAQTAADTDMETDLPGAVHVADGPPGYARSLISGLMAMDRRIRRQSHFVFARQIGKIFVVRGSISSRPRRFRSRIVDLFRIDRLPTGQPQTLARDSRRRRPRSSESGLHSRLREIDLWDTRRSSASGTGSSAGVVMSAMLPAIVPRDLGRLRASAVAVILPTGDFARAS